MKKKKKRIPNMIYENIDFMSKFISSLISLTSKFNIKIYYHHEKIFDQNDIRKNSKV